MHFWQYFCGHLQHLVWDTNNIHWNLKANSFCNFGEDKNLKFVHSGITRSSIYFTNILVSYDIWIHAISMHSVTDKTYGTEYNCNRWLSRAWPPRVCKHFVCCLRTNCKKYKSTILQTCTFWIEFPDQLRRTRLKNIILFYFIKYEEIGNKNGVFFTFSPIKRLIFTQKGTFDFEVFSHIHVLRSMFF